MAGKAINRMHPRPDSAQLAGAKDAAGAPAAEGAQAALDTRRPDVSIDQARPAEQMVIEPRKNWWAVDFAELWRFREVIYFLVWRDFKVRYRQTVLGVTWALIQPLLTVGVFTVIFSRFARLPTSGIPYPLFALSGFVPWSFFSVGVSTATTAMINNQDLVQRIYFPRLAIPLASIFSGFTNLMIGLMLLAGFMLYFAHPVGLAIFWFPLALLQGVAATVGVGLLLSAANARYRDVGHTVPFVLQIALLASPIAYPSSIVPVRWQWLYSLNPMVGVIDAVRAALLGMPLVVENWLISFAATLFLLASGVLYFNRNERNLADVL